MTEARPIPRVKTPDTSQTGPGEVAEDLARIIGVQLRRAREAADLSQEEVGRFLGYKASVISAYESGTRRLRVDDLGRLCTLLEKSPDYFFQNEDIGEPHPIVGVKLRAELAELPQQSITEDLRDFLDYAERQTTGPSNLPNLGRLKPEQAARKVLSHCAHGEEPPVDLDRVAAHMMIPIINWAFPDALSALVVNTEAGGAVIGVNRAHHPHRRRFSIAHELAHAVLRHRATYYLEFHDYVSPLGEATQHHDREEREANKFAAALLMDSRWLRRDVKAGFNDALTLAARYRVSEEAMSYRLANLGLAGGF